MHNAQTLITHDFTVTTAKSIWRLSTKPSRFAGCKWHFPKAAKASTKLIGLLHLYSINNSSRQGDTQSNTSSRTLPLKSSIRLQLPQSQQGLFCLTFLNVTIHLCTACYINYTALGQKMTLFLRFADLLWVHLVAAVCSQDVGAAPRVPPSFQ